LNPKLIVFEKGRIIKNGMQKRRITDPVKGKKKANQRKKWNAKRGIGNTMTVKKRLG